MRKSKSKGLIAAVLGLIMVLSVVISRVSAEPGDAPTTYVITVQAGDGYAIAANPDPGTGVNRPGEFIVNETNYSGFKNGNDFVGTVTTQDGNILIEIPTGTTVKPNFNNGAFSLKNGNNYLTNETEINGSMTIVVGTPQQNQQQGQGDGQGNGQGDGQGQGQGNQPVQGGEDNIALHVQFTDTSMIGSINGVTFMDDRDGLVNSYEGTVENAGTTSPEGTNTFKFQNSFGERPVREFTINNNTYKAGDEGVAIDEHGAYLITVPGAEVYTITGVGDPNAVLERTVIWANPNYVPVDAKDAEWVKDFLLENGYGYVAAVYDADGNLVDPETYKSPDWYTNENGAGVGKNGFGWINVDPGSKVVFEFYPDYGYQLTDIRINEQNLGLSGLSNSFEFIMPDGNVHFDAVFTKTDDVVKSGSDAVSGGSITLPENTLDRGTAQLKVSDADVSDEKKAEFQNAAEGYTISNYFDLDLYQVFYKGKNDPDDVWSKEITELNGEAVISIKLADGISADDIVIVHNVHDGDEFEVIEILSYDESTNTVTFKAKSFSGYAIATKGDGKKSDSPKTGDKLIFYGAILVVAVAGLTFAIIKKKNSKK